jgi:hypothetical protein
LVRPPLLATECDTEERLMLRRVEEYLKESSKPGGGSNPKHGDRDGEEIDPKQEVGP